MLVVMIDLHLTDGSSGETIHSGAFKGDERKGRAFESWSRALTKS